MRRAELHPFVCDLKYGKAKESLPLDFERFLSRHSGCPPKSSFALPLDVLRFLHSRDQGGCTQVHALDCAHLGLLGLFSCGCPLRRRMLRSSFNDLGRRFHLNPCDSFDIKAWVKSCAKEQQQRRVPIKQAKPTFSTHWLIVSEISYRLSSTQGWALLSGQVPPAP